MFFESFLILFIFFHGVNGFFPELIMYAKWIVSKLLPATLPMPEYPCGYGILVTLQGKNWCRALVKRLLRQRGWDISSVFSPLFRGDVSMLSIGSQVGREFIVTCCTMCKDCVCEHACVLSRCNVCFHNCYLSLIVLLC